MIPQLIRIRPTATIRLAACPNIVSLLTNSSYERIPATRLCKKIVRDREWLRNRPTPRMLGCRPVWSSSEEESETLATAPAFSRV